MKKFLLLFVSLSLLLLSCSDDENNITPSNSIIKGEWYGENIGQKDTITYKLLIDELNGIISGNGELNAKISMQYNGMNITQTTIRKNSINGTFNKPSIKTNFNNDTTNFFIGNLSSDNKRMTGKIEVVNELSGDEFKYDIELIKK